ncbi:YibE/F family protein [Deinococcus humi]|uniref:Putative membrane protein n=1 Tax=Deinococcus humi TaxID=662880 RepID=A0A7W8NH27_9DEIO|nr:putative membrane protein [Deinococcus humi]
MISKRARRLCLLPLLALLPLLLGGCVQLPDSPLPIGTYLRGTYEQQYSQSEVVVTLENGEVINALAYADGPTYTQGEAVVIYQTGTTYVLNDPVRTPYLGWLLGAVMVIAVVVARGKGLRAILGSGLTLLALWLFILPALLSGHDSAPLTISALGAVLAVCVYLVHGLNWKSHAALTALWSATTAGYFITLLLAHLTHLSGGADRAAVVAQNSYGINALSLYVVGVVLSAMGAMNDVTVTQASVVETVAQNQPGQPIHRLYALGMQVGRDHVGSMVTVLVLGYAAGALPLMLLLRADPKEPMWVTLNGEALFSELAGLLIALITMLLAVPLSTGLAAWWVGTHQRIYVQPPIHSEGNGTGG